MDKSLVKFLLGAGVVLAPLGAQAQEFNIAYFASSAQNGYNQSVFDGMAARAREMGVSLQLFDGQFDATKQYAQVEDVLASGKFDGYVIMANDTVGIAGAVEQVTQAGKPIATVLFPLGPDLTSLEPQIQGLTATFAYPPAEGARIQAQSVVDFCANLDPCNVAIVIGFKGLPFDDLRLKSYREVLDTHANIKVVAEVEGAYSPDPSLTGMQDVLQAHPDVHAILSTADQQTIGAQIAVESAGKNVADMFISSIGGTTIAVERVRSGDWDNTYLHLPSTMGDLALQAVVAALKGEPVEAAVNMETKTDLPPLLTKDVLDANPDFKGEWVQ